MNCVKLRSTVWKYASAHSGEMSVPISITVVSADSLPLEGAKGLSEQCEHSTSIETQIMNLTG